LSSFNVAASDSAWTTAGDVAAAKQSRVQKSLLM
jgi:hypothetical protein